jgi:hypothetical protein
MRTYHAVSQGRNWTRYEQPDAANTEGTLIEASHPCLAACRGPSKRRRGTLAASKRVLGPSAARAATAVLGANILRAKPGDVVSMHAELGVRGAHPRLQAATSAALATDNRRVSRSAKDSHMRKIDAFAQILPRSYLERLERQLEKTMAPSRLDYYREGVFSFDPVLTDLDARWR